jgi:hypothetical protein
MKFSIIGFFSKKAALRAVIGSIVMVLGLGAAFVSVSPASALTAIVQTVSMKSGSGQPPCPPPANGQVQACVTSLTFNGSALGGQAKSSDIDNGSVTVLSYIQAKGLATALVKKLTKRGLCRWVGEGTNVPVFTNSGARNGSGAYGKFKDTRRTFVCHTGKGPSGWQKVFNIENGKKVHFCGNWIWFGISKPLIKGKVLVVRNAAAVKMHLHAAAHVVLIAICGRAEAWGYADVVVSLSDYVRTRGNTQARIRLSGKSVGRAVSKASASISCIPIGTTPTTTVVVTTPAPPPTTTTNTTTTTKTITTTTTTTVPTTTTTPAQHSCSLNEPNVPKDANPYVAKAIVTGDVAPSSISWNWGDGNVTSGVDGVSTTRQHTYPTPAPGAAGYVSYVIDVHADFGTQKNVPCGMVQFSVPIPPPSGTTTVPTLPGG